MIEVKRKLEQGFKIEASSLRLLQTNMAGHIAKSGQAPSADAIHVLFRDGTRQPIPDLEDIFQLQNTGQKAIESIELEFKTGPDKNSSTHYISVAATAPSRSERDGNLSYVAISDDRTWNRAVQSDLDEFCSLVRRLDIGKFVDGSIIVAFLLAIGGLVTTMFLTMSSIPDPAARLPELRTALSDDTLSTNDALYRYAEWSVAGRPPESYARYMLVFLLPALLLMALSVLKRSSPDLLWKCHIFYFGNMIDVIRQRRFYHTLVWSGIVLAAIVGVLANYVSGLILR